MKKFTHRRHFFKAITWRVIGTIDTIVLSWILTGNLSFGLKVGGLELFTKISLYYLHDRVWYQYIRLEKTKSSVRHMLKTITWRIVGTIDTVVLAYILSGNIGTGIQIGSLELLTKSILYFMHERVWYRSDFQLIK